MITVMVPLNSNNNVSGSGNNNHNQQQLGTSSAQCQQQRSSSTTQTPAGMVGLNNEITNNGVAQQQHSSSENSEQSLENSSMISGRISNYKQIANQMKLDADAAPGKQQKTILLKFPQNLMDSDQLIVSLYKNVFYFFNTQFYSQKLVTMTLLQEYCKIQLKQTKNANTNQRSIIKQTRINQNLLQISILLLHENVGRYVFSHFLKRI